MAQPKNPPLSVRLAPDLLSALKDEAERRGVAVNALVATAVRKEIGKWSDEEAAALKINRIPPGPVSWPSGALMEPHHTEDPAPKLTLGSAVTYGYQRPKPGALSKTGKAKR